jgi:hypothetical protein
MDAVDAVECPPVEDLQERVKRLELVEEARAHAKQQRILKIYRAVDTVALFIVGAALGLYIGAVVIVAVRTVRRGFA